MISVFNRLASVSIVFLSVLLLLRLLADFPVVPDDWLEDFLALREDLWHRELYDCHFKAVTLKVTNRYVLIYRSQSCNYVHCCTSKGLKLRFHVRSLLSHRFDAPTFNFNVFRFSRNDG